MRLNLLKGGYINKITLLKIVGISLSGLLLIGAGGCSKTSPTPATDTNLNQGAESPTPTPTPTPANSESSSNLEVKFSGGKFLPGSITIKVGDTVQFVNEGTGTVRVSSNPHPLHTDLPGFDDVNGSAPGDSYSYTFSKAGTWGYHDHLNPSAKGTVVVE